MPPVETKTFSQIKMCRPRTNHEYFKNKIYMSKKSTNLCKNFLYIHENHTNLKTELIIFGPNRMINHQKVPLKKGQKIICEKKIIYTQNKTKQLEEQKYVHVGQIMPNKKSYTYGTNY